MKSSKASLHDSLIEPGILPVFRLFVGAQVALNGWEWWRSGRTGVRPFGERLPQLAERLPLHHK